MKSNDLAVVGYIHRLHTEGGDQVRYSDSEKSPFGKVGVDFDPSYTVSCKALIEQESAPTIVDLANADADGYRNGRASVFADLGAAFDAGWNASNEGWNSELPGDAEDRPYWKETKERAIAAIIAAGGSVKE